MLLTWFLGSLTKYFRELCKEWLTVEWKELSMWQDAPQEYQSIQKICKVWNDEEDHWAQGCEIEDKREIDYEWNEIQDEVNIDWCRCQVKVLTI